METLHFPTSRRFYERLSYPRFYLISTLPTGVKISTQVYFKKLWKNQQHPYLSEIVLRYYYLLHIGLPVPRFIPSGGKQQEYAGIALCSSEQSLLCMQCYHSAFFYIFQADMFKYAVYIVLLLFHAVSLAESWLFMKWGFIWGLLGEDKSRVPNWYRSGMAAELASMIFKDNEGGMSVSSCRFGAAPMKHYTDRSMNRA